MTLVQAITIYVDLDGGGFVAEVEGLIAARGNTAQVALLKLHAAMDKVASQDLPPNSNVIPFRRFQA